MSLCLGARVLWAGSDVCDPLLPSSLWVIGSFPGVPPPPALLLLPFYYPKLRATPQLGLISLPPALGGAQPWAWTQPGMGPLQLQGGGDRGFWKLLFWDRDAE